MTGARAVGTESPTPRLCVEKEKVRNRKVANRNML